MSEGMVIGFVVGFLVGGIVIGSRLYRRYREAISVLIEDMETIRQIYDKSPPEWTVDEVLEDVGF